MEHRMPKLATQGVLERVVGERKDPDDRYAGYVVGAEGRKLLRKHRGMSVGTLPSVDVSDHAFFNTDVTTELHLALGEDFTFQKVQPFATENIHYERQEYGLREQIVKKRVSINLTPDYTFLTPWRLHHVESDNADGVDETGKKRKSEPIKRATLSTQQDLYRKVLGYLGGLLYGRRNYRVLIVTRSSVRVMNMIETLYPSLYDQGGAKFKDFILLNYIDALKTDPLGSWCNLAGESTLLVPEEYHGAVLPDMRARHRA
jgi:hypothetical protein